MAIESGRYYRIKGSLLITLLAAAGISGGGVTALFASGDLANAKSTQHAERVTVRLSNGARNSIVSLIDSELCPDVDTAFGLVEGTCTAPKLVKRVGGNIDLTPVDSDDDGIADAFDMGAQIVVPATISIAFD